jgi:hypothetical protein
MHTIKITISKDGKVESQLDGLPGAGCINDLTWLSTLFDIVNEHLTEEYFKDPEVQIDTCLYR